MKNLAMAVVVRDGKILVQERFRHKKGMVYEFPGGSIDEGETPEQAAMRELWEETGLENLKVVASHKSINEFGSDIHYVILNAPPAAEPQAVNPDRKQTFFWFRPEEIPKKDFYKADVEFIETYLENLIRSLFP